VNLHNLDAGSSSASTPVPPSHRDYGDILVELIFLNQNLAIFFVEHGGTSMRIPHQTAEVL